MAKTCPKCGTPLLWAKGLTGLCRGCYLKTGASRRGRGIVVRGKCHRCGKTRPIPEGKDARWFMCAGCLERAADSGEWCDASLGF